MRACSVVSHSCDPMDCSLPGSFVHGISQARNTGMGCHFLLQEIFTTQGSNPSLLHLLQACSLPLSQQKSPQAGSQVIKSCPKDPRIQRCFSHRCRWRVGPGGEWGNSNTGLDHPLTPAWMRASACCCFICWDPYVILLGSRLRWFESSYLRGDGIWSKHLGSHLPEL